MSDRKLKPCDGSVLSQASASCEASRRITTMVSPHDTSARLTAVGKRARSAATDGLWGCGAAATSGRAGLGDGVAEGLRDLVHRGRIQEHAGLGGQLLDAQRRIEDGFSLDLLLEHHDAVQ